MNLEQPSTPAPLDLHASVAEQLEHEQQHQHQRPPIEYLSFQGGMRRSSAGQQPKDQPKDQHHKSNPLRHSTGTMMMTVMDASSNSYNTMEISVSDLKNHRRRHHHLEDSSSKTATTVNSSYHNISSSGHHSHTNQSALFGNSFIRASNSTLDTSDCSASAATQPRRGGSLNDLDDSSGLSIGSSGRRRELRNLKGIRRRRSDPVTRRWREQCSKLYKEHVLLDSCPEQQQQNQPPPLTSTATPQVLAATKLQAWVRAALRQQQRKGCSRQQTTS